MPKLPRITPKKLIAALKRRGFAVDRQRGSHVILLGINGRRTIIPMHAKDLPLGTLKGILNDLNLANADLSDLLAGKN